MSAGPRCPGCGYTIQRMLAEGLEVVGIETGQAWRSFVVAALDPDGTVEHEGIDSHFEHDGRSPFIQCGNCGHEWRTRNLTMGYGS